jgi:PhnB protein
MGLSKTPGATFMRTGSSPVRRIFISADKDYPDFMTTSIAPLLSVRRGAKAVEFYKAAFGATELFRLDAPDGAVVAQLSVEGAEFWVADESPEHFNFSPESLGGGTVRLVMVVEDPDAVFARAVAAGAKVVWPVGEQHGWRVGRVVDPFGHHWEIGKPLA